MSMEIGGFIKDAVKWIAANFGKDILAAAAEQLQHQWRRLFAARNILILGPKQTGKSSLVQYLKSGRPYEVIDGEIRPPAPTAAAAVVDHKFALQKGAWLRIKKDAPGDPGLRFMWAQMIADIQPHGIIYMVDGRHADDALRADVQGIREFVLGLYPETVGPLSTLHVFVNFADHWAGTAVERNRRVRVVREALERLTVESPKWEMLRFGVAAIQLSPNKQTWEDAQRALQHFGADLLA